MGRPAGEPRAPSARRCPSGPCVVSPAFTVAVKFNSADFQRGGFDADDAATVISMLEPLGVDLVELSGGSYESPAMSGRPTDGRIAAREAYFLELAAELAKSSPLPLMLTGGITRRETAEQVLSSGVEVVGIATAIAVTPDLPNRWREGREATQRLKPVTWSDKTLASAASMALVRHQMRRITRGSTQPARPTRSTRSSATSVTSGARCAVTATGSRAARALHAPPPLNTATPLEISPKFQRNLTWDHHPESQPTTELEAR